MTTMPALEVEDVWVAYPSGRRAAVDGLRGISLSVADGEILVIVGPSGSGKTTLLHVVAGLVAPHRGRVRIDGTDVTARPAGDRNLSLVFQDLALLPHLDVAGNIGFGERARGVPVRELRPRVRAVAESFGLTELMDRRPGALSGGERQKVALARAVIREPRAFLMDEPLSHLDPLVRHAARSDLLHLRDRLGAPIVYVTHDPHEALAFGDRIAVLHAGELVQVGSPDDLYTRPHDTFVASFVGPLPMNLVGHPNGTTGIRPEHVSLTEPDQGRLRGQVSRVLHAGSDAVLHVECGGHDPVVVRTTWAERLAVGAEVGLGWRTDDEHHFDQHGLRVE